MTFGALALSIQLVFAVRWIRDMDVAILVADTPGGIADFKTRGLLPAVNPDAGVVEVIWNRDNSNIVGSFRGSRIDVSEFRRRLRVVGKTNPPDPRLEQKLRAKTWSDASAGMAAENAQGFALVVDTATSAVGFWSPCGNGCDPLGTP